MAKENKKTKTEAHEQKAEANVSEPRPRGFITMATDGQTMSAPIRTTREIYMEQVKSEDSSEN